MTQGTGVFRVKGWLSCFAAVCMLVPLLGAASADRQGDATTGPNPVLGVTPVKVLGFTPKSVRDADYPLAIAVDLTGDTYDAAGLLQDATNAYMLDDVPDSHTFGTADETAGANLLSNVDTRIVGTDFGPGAPGTNWLQVNYFSADGSELVPAGSVAPTGLVFDSWRMDIGTTAAGTDKIGWTPAQNFTVVDSGYCLFQAGSSLGCFGLILDDSDAVGVSGVGIIGLGGGDIAGFGVDEMVMYWEVQLSTSCGDGIVIAGEECDDGNNVNGDGCSSTCTLEAELFGDVDGDGDVDLYDLSLILPSFTGPAGP